MLRTSACEQHAQLAAQDQASVGFRATRRRAAIRWKAARAALDVTAEAVLVFAGSSLRVVDANRAACAALGYEQRELLGMSLADIAARGMEDRLTAAVAQLVETGSDELTLAAACRHKSEAELPVEVAIRRVQQGRHQALVLVARRFDETKHDGATPSTFRDALTGLATRAWLEARLEWATARARREGYRFALLFIDVDDFKRVNDGWGHLAGDAVLRAVAARLAASVRPTDLVARYGGDEFVALVGDVGQEWEAVEVARRISRALRVSVAVDGSDGPCITVTASMGAALGSGRFGNGAELVQRADQAMYRAKAMGRNGHWVLDVVAGAGC